MLLYFAVISPHLRKNRMLDQNIKNLTPDAIIIPTAAVSTAFLAHIASPQRSIRNVILDIGLRIDCNLGLSSELIETLQKIVQAFVFRSS